MKLVTDTLSEVGFIESLLLDVLCWDTIIFLGLKLIIFQIVSHLNPLLHGQLADIAPYYYEGALPEGRLIFILLSTFH